MDHSTCGRVYEAQPINVTRWAGSTVDVYVGIDVTASGPGSESVEVGPFEFLKADWIAPDTDFDGLDDEWEERFGLDSTVGTGSDGPAGDPDGDGQDNISELTGGSHPRGFHKLYFAEGATSDFFETTLAMLNPTTARANALVRHLMSDGTAVTRVVSIDPMSVVSVDPDATLPMRGVEFSTIVESDVPLAADRTMTWDAEAYGAHSETAIVAPSSAWYLAEGATHSGFDLFYLLQNPSPDPVTVLVRYLLPSAPPLEKTYSLPPTSRTNIWVNHEDLPGAGRVLASTDVSAVVRSVDGTPIIVERAMYLTRQGRLFEAGHESAGLTSASTKWFLAEGATGPFFDSHSSTCSF
jgi:hypothetical protein